MSVFDDLLYFETRQKDYNILSSLLPDQNNIFISNARYSEYWNTSKPLVVFAHLSLDPVIRNFIKARNKARKKTYLVYDFSYESGLSTQDFNTLNYKIPDNRKLYIFNKSGANNEHKVKNKLFIDWFAISAIKRKEAGFPVCNLPLEQRRSAINLLIGKVYKNNRLTTLKKFFEKNLLDSMIIGLLGNPEDIPDRKLRKQIAKYFSSADNVKQVGTDTSQGYADNTFVYDNSTVSYVIETWEHINEEPYTFLTEKTYRPILNKSPFVLQGSKGMYADLEKKGFKCYSEETMDIDKLIKNAQDLQRSIEIDPLSFQKQADSNYNNLKKIADSQCKLLETAVSNLIAN